MASMSAASLKYLQPSPWPALRWPLGCLRWSRVVLACSINGCSDTVIARGWCSKHYCRWKAHGDANFLKQRTSQCFECGSNFVGHPKRKFCGDVCRSKNKNVRLQRRYATNKVYRRNILDLVHKQRGRIKADPERLNRQRERDKLRARRRRSNPEIAQAERLAAQLKYSNDPDYRKSRIAQKINRYHNDFEFRMARRKIRQSPAMLKKSAEYSRKWYANNTSRKLISQKIRAEKLTDGFIANQLRLPLQVANLLIPAKRAQLKLYRALKKGNPNV
jgi:hypothetical protein